MTLLNFVKNKKVFKTKKFIQLTEDDYTEAIKEFWIEPKILNPKAKIKDRKIGFSVCEKIILLNEKMEFESIITTLKTYDEAIEYIKFWVNFYNKLAEKKKVWNGRYFFDYEIDCGELILKNKSLEI